MKYVWQAIKDWKIYVFMLICLAGFCPIYSFALFLPTIIKNMGYTSNDAQLMSVPPYVCACFFTIAASWYADRVRKRGVFLMGFQVIAERAVCGYGACCDWYISSDSARYGVEQREYWRKLEARDGYCDASHGRELWWYHCELCVLD
jgi:cyanate permease